MKKIKEIIYALIDLFIKAHYHEFVIKDKNGNIVGTEFTTTRIGVLSKTDSPYDRIEEDTLDN
jgi:hypothetical protein